MKAPCLRPRFRCRWWSLDVAAAVSRTAADPDVSYGSDLPTRCNIPFQQTSAGRRRPRSKAEPLATGHGPIKVARMPSQEV
jgi:hypothetical protein